MALVKPDAARFAKIKVLGIGGGGGNAVNSMLSSNNIVGVDFVAINTDAQALLANQAGIKIQIGENLTRGLGVGGDPELGRQAAEESKEKIKEILGGSDMVFITGGMGGGTATGASPIIAQIAREIGALTIAVVTKPFAFEGARRTLIAQEGLVNLKDNVDAMIVIPNQRLMETVDKSITLVEAFKMLDNILGQGVQGISDIITVPGLINRDFADVKTIMKNAGSAFMGIGIGTGENKAEVAASSAISSPLLEVSIEGAKGILFTITGGFDLTMMEVEQASKIISQHAGADANIIFGAAINQEMTQQIKVSVIATGFDEARMYSPKIKPPVDRPGDGVKSSEEITGKPDGKSEEHQLPQDEMGEEFEVPAFIRLGR